MRLIIVVLFLNLQLYSQTKKVLNDFSFTLHEELVNKVLAAIGEVSGTNDYEVMFIKGKYHWKIVNPQIQIRPDSSHFICDALVNVGPLDYKTKVVGDVKITYDKIKDKISIKITRAIFELYTIVFEKKIHIKDIHLEDNFKDPFLFDGPKAYATSMDISLPDSAKKTLYIQPSDCDVIIKWKEVCAVCEAEVSDKPFKLPASATPPKANTTYNQTPSKPTETKSVTPQKK